MKDIFDRHQARLTDTEDRRIWQATHDAIRGRRSRWIRWGVPTIASTAFAAIALAVVMNTGTLDRRHPDDLMAGKAPGTLGEKPQGTDSVAPPALAQRDDDAAAEENLDAKPPGTEAESVEEAPAEPVAESRAAAPPAERRRASTADAAPAPAVAAEATRLKTRMTRVAPGTISGVVTNENGESLPYANIQVLNTRWGAVSDTSGAFTIQDVPPGDYTVKIAYLGYESKQEPLTVTGGEDLALDVTLSESLVTTMVGLTVEAREMESDLGAARDERLPVDTFADAVKRKGEEVGSGGQYHSRGGRTGKVRFQIDGKPAPPPTPATLGAVRPADADASRISVGGTDPVNDEAFDAMFFRHYGVNPFIDPQEDRFATFAVDVDNASYAMARSYLRRGELPPRDAIRIEEFVNAFDHGYPAPGGFRADRRPAPSERGTFAIYLDAAPSPFGNDLVLLRVGLKGKEVAERDRKPAVLTFVIDVSGSMQREDRLELVKRSLHLLLDRMTNEDRVGLVVYGSNARTILPATSLRDRRAIERAIDSLRPEGSTNAEAGLREAYALADREFRSGAINRIILCSDGVANVGRTGAESILSVIETEARRGIELTAIGFGMGNYNDVLLEQLANKADGNYYYVDEIDEARRVFVENLTGTLQTIARQTKIQVEFDPERVRRYRLLGYENRDVADRDFRNDAVDAGEVGAGHEVTALFELKLERGARRGELATVRIRYEDPESGRVTEEARDLSVADIRRSLDDADPTFRRDAAVAEFAEILRHSYWAKDGDLGDVLALARDTERDLAGTESSRELLELVETARRLWPADGTETDPDIRPAWDPDRDPRR